LIAVSNVPITRAVKTAFFGVPSPSIICGSDGGDAVPSLDDILEALPK
jgi:hypothetical protein